jgi:hypothetical protein
MGNYTIRFLHPADQLLEHTHFYALSIWHVHMMFLGELANVWGFGWNNLQFSDETDLSKPVGCITFEGKPLHYEIIQGHQEPEG